MILSSSCVCLLFLLDVVWSFEIQRYRWGFNGATRPPVYGNPDKIYRVRLSLGATKQVMQVNFGGVQVFDFYDMRVRWSEPVSWNDDGDADKRHYKFICYVSMENEKRTLAERQTPFWYQGYRENFRFPSNFPAYVQCEIYPVNSLGRKGESTFTTSKKVSDVPVYFADLPGVDLRGIPDEDIIAILTNAANEYVDTS